MPPTEMGYIYTPLFIYLRTVAMQGTVTFIATNEQSLSICLSYLARKSRLFCVVLYCNLRSVLSAVDSGFGAGEKKISPHPKQGGPKNLYTKLERQTSSCRVPWGLAWMGYVIQSIHNDIPEKGFGPRGTLRTAGKKVK